MTTFSNSVGISWTGAIKKRGELDKTPEVTRFGERLEAAVLGCIEDNIVTKDLVSLITPAPKSYETTEGFIDKVAERLVAVAK